MNCPKCSNPNAQQLFTSFLCINKKCNNYDKKHYAHWLANHIEAYIPKKAEGNCACEPGSPCKTHGKSTKYSIGKDVYILGQPVDLIPLDTFKVTINVPASYVDVYILGQSLESKIRRTIIVPAIAMPNPLTAIIPFETL